MAPRKKGDASTTTSGESVEAIKFSKPQLVRSKKYAGQEDLLNALLKDGTRYSFDEADTLIADFMKGRVK